MKNKLKTLMKPASIFLTLMMVSAYVLAQQVAPTGIVKLRGTRLTYPLVEKWIAEFNKEYPSVKVTIAPSAPLDSIDFTIASYALEASDLTGDREAVAVSRYVQLPIANSQRPGLAQLQKKGLTQQELNDLFFTANTPSFISASAQLPVLYVRDRPVCAVKAFATHFGNDPKSLKGTQVKGDDQDLAQAVRKDINGLSFNNLGFIYSVETRKVKDSLAIIPLDLNENGTVDPGEQIYNTLDDVIAYVEKTHDPKFINERVNFVFSRNSKNAVLVFF